MAESRIGAFHGARPKPCNDGERLTNERFQVWPLGSHGCGNFYLRIQVANALFRFIAHPRAIAAHIFSQPTGTAPTNCGLRIADCGLLRSDGGLRTADCGLRIADCGLRIADCGLYSMSMSCLSLTKRGPTGSHPANLGGISIMALLMVTATGFRSLA